MSTATPGFLAPTNTTAYDDALLDLLQPIIVGIGGYSDPTMVRPRWQPTDTPNLPAYNADWIAFGVSGIRGDGFIYEEHLESAPGAGYDSVEYSEEVDLLMSCYGPNSQRFMKTLRDGFKIGQNRSYLHTLKMDLIYVGEPVTVPALLTGVWVRRVDFTITLRRKVQSTYAVETVVLNPSGNGLDNELYVTPIIPHA